MIGEHFRGFAAFVKLFAMYAHKVWMSLAILVSLLIGGGLLVAWIEGLSPGDGIYFSLVTGLSIGYGDITPKTIPGRVVSILIGIAGLLVMGLTVAVATRALADATKQSHHKGHHHQAPS